MTKAQTMERIEKLMNTLSFEDLIKVFEKVENMDIAEMIIERMFELDEERAIEFEKNY